MRSGAARAIPTLAWAFLLGGLLITLLGMVLDELNSRRVHAGVRLREAL